MSNSEQYHSPTEAARRLGVSVKALRVYEQRGLIDPVRTEAGWRAYGPNEMTRAADIAALRALGFSLAQIARVLDRQADGLEQALAGHQATLEARAEQLSMTIGRVRGLRDEIANGRTPKAADLTRLLGSTVAPVVSFDLPWPWGGERFDLRDMRRLTHIVGPLGSGKTKLIQRLAETLPDAVFLGLDRLNEDGAAARARLADDPALAARVDRTLAWLVEDGAVTSNALVALLAALESEKTAHVVIDMIEQGLDAATQQALIAHLRRRGPGAPAVIATTRSSAFLDLADIGPDEAVYLCPANHAPPTRIAPHPGAPGYEAVTTCLAAPDVRARTGSVVAAFSPAA